MTLKMVLKRSSDLKDRTLGTLSAFKDGRYYGDLKTLEPPWKENGRNVSCIPKGIYRLKKKTSKSKGFCFEVLDVPERNGILIHRGNFPKDTQGCILPGFLLKDIDGDGKREVANSKNAMEWLESISEGIDEGMEIAIC